MFEKKKITKKRKLKNKIIKLVWQNSTHKSRILGEERVREKQQNKEIKKRI